jgi:hypothetical protein
MLYIYTLPSTYRASRESAVRFASCGLRVRMQNGKRIADKSRPLDGATAAWAAPRSPADEGGRSGSGVDGASRPHIFKGFMPMC